MGPRPCRGRPKAPGISFHSAVPQDLWSWRQVLASLNWGRGSPFTDGRLKSVFLSPLFSYGTFQFIFRLPMTIPSNIVELPVASRPRDSLGRPLHDLRISVMDRCNFRCPYCMPRETFHENYRFLKSAERLSFEEIVRLTRLFVELGVKKVRLTGGEPLLRPNLPELIGELTSL